MTSPRARARALLVALVATAGVAAACGSDSDGDLLGDAGPVPEIEVAAASADSTLPAVVVRDVGAEEWVQLADNLPREQPLLVWFWAPH